MLNLVMTFLKLSGVRTQKSVDGGEEAVSRKRMMLAAAAHG
jgi:hypothetical protein